MGTRTISQKGVSGPGHERECRFPIHRHRVVAFNRLGESIADTPHKGDHVLVDGLLVSSTYKRENDKAKKAKVAKVTIFWSVRANSIRRLSSAEGKAPSTQAAAEPGDAPF